MGGLLLNFYAMQCYQHRKQTYWWGYSWKSSQLSITRSQKQKSIWPSQWYSGFYNHEFWRHLSLNRLNKDDLTEMKKNVIDCLSVQASLELQCIMSSYFVSNKLYFVQFIDLIPNNLNSNYYFYDDLPPISKEQYFPPKKSQRWSSLRYLTLFRHWHSSALSEGVSQAS